MGNRREKQLLEQLLLGLLLIGLCVKVRVLSVLVEAHVFNNYSPQAVQP